MKNKYLSIIVVIFTMVSVGIMISGNMFIKGVEQDNHILVSQNEGNKKGQINKAAEKVPSEKNQQQKQDEKNANENDNIVIGVETKEIAANSENMHNAEENQDNYSPIFTVVNSQEPSYPTNAAVFKVNAEEILQKISLADKVKILAIVTTNISPVDYAKIVNYLQDDNYSRGIINVFSLLKKRLKSNEYEQLRKTASKYVDVNCIESYIN